MVHVEFFCLVQAGVRGVGLCFRDAEDLLLQSVDIVTGDDGTAGGVDHLGTAAGPEGDHGSAAGQGFHIDRGIVILPGGIDKQIRGGVDLRQLGLILGAVDGDDTFGKVAVNSIVRTHQDDLKTVVQTGGKLHEHVQPLANTPAEGHPEKDELPLATVLFAEVALRGLEHREVDSVVDHLHGVVFQEGLPYQPRKPVRRRDDGEILHPGEPLLLAAVHEFGVVHVTFGIFPMLGTVVTPGLPLVTLRHGEMGTMPGERPAVVQRPDHRDVVLFDVPKKHGEVDVAPVKIVKVDEIGRNIRDFLQHPFCREARKAPLKTGEPRQQDIYLPRAEGADFRVWVHGFFCSVGDGYRRKAVSLVPLSPGLLSNAKHNITGTAKNAAIDLYDGSQ